MLQEYYDFTEKDEVAQNGGAFVQSIDIFLEELYVLKKQGDFIFRGVSEAKFKLYNSAQREFINLISKGKYKGDIRQDYDLFLQEKINYCLSLETIKRYLQAHGISPNNTLAVLSIMQHYGLPTPFIDFTHNPFIALYFAAEGVKYIQEDLKNPLNNYFSVYTTYKKARAFEVWTNIFYENVSVNNEVLASELSLSKISKNEMGLILPEHTPFKILNNINIINQEGLFFYNRDPVQPIDLKYIEYVNHMKEKIGESVFNQMLFHDKFVKCFNIHKMHAPGILDFLKEIGITTEFLFPSFEKIRN